MQMKLHITHISYASEAYQGKGKESGFIILCTSYRFIARSYK